MKGCIIKNDEISIKEIYTCIENVDKYNWLITNIECYPSEDKIIEDFKGDYYWISGKDLLQILLKEDFQWIWGVFSAFDTEVKLKDILSCTLPYADGYTGFWKNPISLQNPLAKIEIVSWDGIMTLVIANENNVIKTIMDKTGGRDLELYNME